MTSNRERNDLIMIVILDKNSMVSYVQLKTDLHLKLYKVFIVLKHACN